MSELAELLGTDDERAQVERVRALLALARAPLLTFIVQFDQRDGTTTITALDSNGRALPFAVGHKMLDLGRQALIELEKRAERQAERAKDEQLSERD